MNVEDFQRDLLVELKRIAGALEGSEKQIECLCQHFGAATPRNNNKARKSGGGK